MWIIITTHTADNSPISLYWNILITLKVLHTQTHTHIYTYINIPSKCTPVGKLSVQYIYICICGCV